MKLNARWALPVYPVWKDQSHSEMCEHILKKHCAPIQFKFFDRKKNLGAL